MSAQRGASRVKGERRVGDDCSSTQLYSMPPSLCDEITESANWKKYAHEKRGVPVTHEYLYRRRKTRPRLGEPLVQELAASSQDIVQMAERREGSSMNRIKQSSPLQAEHLFARSPKVIRGAEANDIIEATIVRDIPGARLNATLLKDCVPVIVTQAPPLHAPTLRKLNNEEFTGKIGWEDAFRKLGWCMLYDSCLVVCWDEGLRAHVFHCLLLSHHQSPCIAASRKDSQWSIDTVLDSLVYVIGRSYSTIFNGVKLRGFIRGGLVAGSAVKGEMAMEGWVNEFIPPRDGPDKRESTYAYYQVKPTVDAATYMPTCARHIVAMNTLERLFCPGANEARWTETKHLGGIYPDMGELGAGTGFTAMAGCACELRLDSSARGTFETILFSAPPDLPPGHKWSFALADAGVLIDLHKSPAFLILPGRDVLHGTMFTGKGTGEDHIEHSSGVSALMNKLRMTGASSKAYERLHLAKERRACSHDPKDV